MSRLNIRREIGQVPASPPQQRVPQMPGPPRDDEHVSPAAHAGPVLQRQTGAAPLVSHHSPDAQQEVPQQEPVVQSVQIEFGPQT
jgi:hypothetical protein